MIIKTTGSMDCFRSLHHVDDILSLEKKKADINLKVKSLSRDLEDSKAVGMLQSDGIAYLTVTELHWRLTS